MIRRNKRLVSQPILVETYFNDPLTLVRKGADGQGNARGATSSALGSGPDRRGHC